jgi:hypothetical protein
MEGIVFWGDKEAIMKRDFAQPIVHAFGVPVEALFEMDRGLAKSLNAVDAVDDGLCDDVEINNNMK